LFGAVASAAWLACAGGALAQSADPEPGSEPPPDDTPPPAERPHGRDLVLAPIPQTDPTLGAGLTVVGALLYQPEGGHRPWTTGAAAMYTDSRSWGVALMQKAYALDERLRITAAAGYGEFHIDFYGVGADAASRGRSVTLDQTAAVFLGQALYQARPEVFIGPRVQVLKLRSGVETPVIPPLDIDPADLDTDSINISLGLAVEYDTRDSEYGPRSGVYATAQWMRSSPAWGADFSYGKSQASINLYRAVGDDAVVAARIYGCDAGAGAPFFDLCLYGSHNDLRGYASGQYRDQAMATAQIEYRRRLFWRIGGVAFAGVGGVAPAHGRWDEGAFLPALGVGARFEVSREYRLNLSLDAAVGDGSSGVYLYLGEAF